MVRKGQQAHARKPWRRHVIRGTRNCKEKLTNSEPPQPDCSATSHVAFQRACLASNALDGRQCSCVTTDGLGPVGRWLCTGKALSPPLVLPVHDASQPARRRIYPFTGHQFQSTVQYLGCPMSLPVPRRGRKAWRGCLDERQRTNSSNSG